MEVELQKPSSSANWRKDSERTKWYGQTRRTRTDADPDIPIFIAAKAEYAKLQ
jgi:hypothetical protein